MFVLDDKMQTVWGTPYDISGQFAPKTQNTRVDTTSFLPTQDTSNHTLNISKDKLLIDGKHVMLADNKVFMH